MKEISKLDLKDDKVKAIVKTLEAIEEEIDVVEVTEEVEETEVIEDREEIGEIEVKEGEEIETETNRKKVTLTKIQEKLLIIRKTFREEFLAKKKV